MRITDTSPSTPTSSFLEEPTPSTWRSPASFCRGEDTRPEGGLYRFKRAKRETPRATFSSDFLIAVELEARDATRAAEEEATQALLQLGMMTDDLLDAAIRSRPHSASGEFRAQLLPTLEIEPEPSVELHGSDWAVEPTMPVQPMAFGTRSVSRASLRLGSTPPPDCACEEAKGPGASRTGWLGWLRRRL